MKIEAPLLTREDLISHYHSTESNHANDSFQSSCSITESLTKTFKSYYPKDQATFIPLFLAAFRILLSKYQFQGEPLLTKIILSNPYTSKNKTVQLFESRIEFPAIQAKQSTIESIFSTSRDAFNKLFNLTDQLVELDSNTLTLLALNTETEQIELDCTIHIDHNISLTFKTPFGSQFKYVVHNSAHHFLPILKAIQSNPERAVASVMILTDREQDNIHHWSESEYNPIIGQPACLHHFFEQTVLAYPTLPAVFCNGQNFSYQEINNRANQLANILLQKGIGKGDYCGILLPRTEEMYIAMLAILKVGAAYIPFDVSIPKDRLHFILNDSNSKGLISHSKFQDQFKNHSCIQIILDEATASIISSETILSLNPSLLPSPYDIAYIIYTSGTTGTPKGVKISHAAICNLVRAEAAIFNVLLQDKIFQGFSISFDASLEEIWLAFYAGAQLFVGTEETVQSGSQMAAFINDNQITVFSTVPTLLATLTEDLPSVSTLILGGESCSMELVNKWSTNKRRMINTYGPTEATVIATWSDCKPNKKVTIGKPVANYSTYILNADQQIVPVGVAGELCIGGLSLSEGYINNRLLTETKFITPDFLLNPNFPYRLYRSGDLVRYDETGEIVFLGRIDSQIKLRGFRIELAEIESQLLKDPAIKNCALTVKKDPNGLEHLIAYVVIHEGIKFDPVATKKELRTKLAPYMIPSRFEVIPEIPLLTSGKLDRKQLPEPEFHKEPVQKKTGNDSNIDYITQLWESMFGLGTISPKDNFFELGGHSLLASQMISELRKDARYEKLSVRDVYTHPTIEKLSYYIDHSASNRNHHDKTTFEAPCATKKVSGVTYITVAFLQLITTIFIYGITAFILLIPLIIIDLIPGITNTNLVLSILGSFTFFYFFWLTLSIAIKWVVIGKFKEGSYPLWGFYYFRFWLVKKFVDMAPVNLMAGTLFINWYFRLMGARIGKNCFLGTDRLRIFDLISIGDDSSLLKESTLLGYKIENEMLHIGNITVGNRCFVGARSILAKNTKMNDDSMLLELSMLGDHETIAEGAVWKGSPARPFHTSHDYKPDYIQRITGFKKAGFYILQLLAILFVLFAPQLLASPFAYIYYKIITDYSMGVILFVSIPLMALFILLFSISISALKWILLGKQKPLDIQTYSIHYIRKWIVDTLTYMSLFYFRSVYATLFLPKWLRTLGVKVGKRAEISTLNHLSADLLEIGNESFLADSTSIGVPMVYLGTMHLRDTHIGDRSFIGNSAVLLPGTNIGNDCLIGVLSTAPVTEDDSKINGSSWLGSPPIYLPNRQESPKFSDKLTFHPPWYLYIVRGSIEFFKITMPYAIGTWLIIFFYTIMIPFNQTLSFAPLITSAMLLLTTLSCSTMIAGIFFKWVLIGRYKPSAKPLWSTFVWRNEFINSITECLIFPFYQNMMLGTFMAPFFFRLMGCKIGSKVYMETTEITEFDLVHIQSGSALNFGSTIQTHLFEDRIMKMSVIDIGKGCTVGAMSVVLYDSKMGNHSTLDGLSLLMKGETLPAHTKWQGSPSGRIN
jgi:non-ribosomal peptide synthetase-like protein